MKCICGYEHESAFVGEKGARKYETIIGDENFIEIEGHFTITKENNYYPNTICEVQIYACPKCGTIKLE